ncbi:uncharacterized protein LOC117105571 [Anneissia japonica]|uniref:uncharacterized protein LOC117105571 n=1 Tax=Anneissia japonica TaxID=1529436 RepID=UPI0014257E2C|nr:uncharacterized protein LOC117105571 [Anneissia japonica]
MEEDANYIGKYSDALGINLSSLEEDGTCRLDGRHLTNGAVLEMRDVVLKLKRPIATHSTWLLKILEQNDVDVSNIKDSTLRGKITVIKNMRQNLKSRNKSKLDPFLSERFAIPVPNTNKKKAVKRRCEEVHLSSCKDCEMQFTVNEKLAAEVKMLEASIVDLKRQLEIKPKVVVKKIGSCKRLNQTIRRKNMQIKCLKAKVQKMKKTMRQPSTPVDQQLTNLKGQLSSIKKQKYRQTSEYNKKTGNLESDIVKVRNKVVVLQRNLRWLEDENTKLNQEIAVFTASSSREIATKIDGKTFNWPVRNAVYFCLEQEVPARNIPHVLRYAVEELAGLKIGVLPDAMSCLRMLREMRELSRMQVSEVLKSATDTTLKYDGTNKKRTHYLEVQISDKDATYTTGITRLPSGTAAANTQGILQTFEDLGAASQATGGSASKQHILDTITNTMTDRCGVNKAVNKELVDSMSDGSKHLNEFFCGMHPLDTFAKSCNQSLSTWEQEILPAEHRAMCFRRRSLSGAQSFIAGVCKLCFNNAVGVPAEIDVFLKSRGIKVTDVLSPVMGNRFHILYRNAGAVHFLLPHIVEFLTKVWLPTNDLQRAVLVDSRTSEYTTGCRALGLIGKYVSGPWMRLVERNQNILDLNTPFTLAVERMENWKVNASLLVRGEAECLFADVPVIKDAVFDNLTTPHENDQQVETLLLKLLDVILDVCKRQLDDQLPGGIHHDPSEALQQQARSCVGNNISGERVFGLLDHYVRRAPNASLSYIESKIVYKSNKTSDWLAKKSVDEREELLSKARMLCLKSKQIDAERRETLTVQKRQHLDEKRKEIVNKEDRARLLNENLLNDLMQYGGLWQDDISMDSNLEALTSNKRQLIALKAQLNVRKKILNQKANASLFCFSFKRKQFSVDKLKENLSVLMSSEDLDDLHIKNIIMDPPVLLEKKIAHLWSNENDGIVSDTWYKCTIDMDVILTDATYKKEEKLFIIKKKKKEERREPITVSYQLRDINTELVKAWQDIFAPHENVVVSEGDIFKDAPATDAIVSPANSFGFMDGGIELAYSRHFGLQLMSRLQETIDNEKDGELLVGDALILSTHEHCVFGKTEQSSWQGYNQDIPIKFLISAPTMRVPMDVSNTMNAYLAFRAVILKVNKHNKNPENDPINSVLCPGLATSFGNMAPRQCALQMKYAYEIYELGLHKNLRHPESLGEVWEKQLSLSAVGANKSDHVHI